jgi:transcriptional regulator of aromatic amino acid metabolism
MGAQHAEEILRVREQAEESVVASDAPVLFADETGSGRAVLARWLHETGPRATERFVDLDCAGLSLELADHGSLFLLPTRRRDPRRPAVLSACGPRRALQRTRP